MLLCCDLTVNWFLILLSSVELFLMSENKTENETFLNKHAPSATLFFETETVSLQPSREKLIAKNVYGMA